MPDEWVHPCFAAFPTGFAWSLYFAQMANQGLVEKVPDLPPPIRLQNFGVGQALQTSKDTVQYIYADNVGVLGGSKQRAQRLKDEAAARLNAAGLGTHDDEAANSRSVNLGVLLDGAAAVARTSETRFWRLDRCLAWALARGRLSPKGMEKLV